MTVSHPPNLLFRGATVVSGDEGEQPYIADVLVRAGLISEIASAIEPPASARVVDATGFMLCPGFIDMHAHSDLYLLSHPDHEPKITQGCTVSSCPPQHRRWPLTRLIRPK